MSGSSHDVGIQFVGDIPTTEQLLSPIDKWFYNDSGATIPANVAVSVDLTKTPTWTRIRQYTGVVATDARLIVGITPAPIPTGKWGRVRVRGEIQCKVNGTCAAGDILIGDATVGQLVVIAAFAVDTRPVAIASEADTANVAKVFVMGTLVA